MNLSKKILQVLKEDDENLFNPKDSEENNLFKPRRIEPRIEKLPSVLRALAKLQKYDVIDIYCIPLKKNIKLLVLGIPIEEQGYYNIDGIVNIKKEDVPKGSEYGLFLEHSIKWSDKYGMWILKELKLYKEKSK